VLTMILILVLVLVAVLYAAVPLVAPRQVDPLPDERDPVLQDLEEDREALFRAIRELEARLDVAPEQREQLRARYEAKAAVVLRAIDDRRAVLDGAPVPVQRPTRRGLPWAPLGLLGAMAISAIALGPFVLPRVGQDATVTTFFAEDLRRAEALRDLMRAAERDPSVATLMPLADAYWQLQDAPQAEATYRRVLLQAETDGSGTAPALAYRRLAMLAVARRPRTRPRLPRRGAPRRPDRRRDALRARRDRLRHRSARPVRRRVPRLPGDPRGAGRRRGGRTARPRGARRPRPDGARRGAQPARRSPRSPTSSGRRAPSTRPSSSTSRSSPSTMRATPRRSPAPASCSSCADAWTTPSG
jgi:hypothetical protein